MDLKYGSKVGVGVLHVLGSPMGSAFGRISGGVGDNSLDTGTTIRFWCDLWCGELILQEAFPKLFLIAEIKKL